VVKSDICQELYISGWDDCVQIIIIYGNVAFDGKLLRELMLEGHSNLKPMYVHVTAQRRAL
jgi:hypothetical protein